MIVIRASKVVLVAAIALFASLVTFGNLTDYNTNWAFVQHVLSMDTIYPFSTIKYRAITDPPLQHAAYAVIIAAEGVIAVLCWVGAVQLARYLRADARAFNAAKTFAVVLAEPASSTRGFFTFPDASRSQVTTMRVRGKPSGNSVRMAAGALIVPPKA